MKAEDDRIAALRDVLLGAEKASFKPLIPNQHNNTESKLKPSQQEALIKIATAIDVAIPHKDIAALLNTSAGAVKARVHRAMKLLRERVEHARRASSN
jgi:DNA-binding NarL/FixJ family response regulator